jgi:hypothetical protein
MLYNWSIDVDKNKNLNSATVEFRNQDDWTVSGMGVQ